ncbi:hypothetical protein [Moraxella oblonga]|uniref:hypothetical protein n=1 Tax=Moraxella oblonga TaxID=200413 RepID=UPI0008370C4E|nr:hypothetical protein [Moraxella oblonga]
MAQIFKNFLFHVIIVAIILVVVIVSWLLFLKNAKVDSHYSLRPIQVNVQTDELILDFVSDKPIELKANETDAILKCYGDELQTEISTNPTIRKLNISSSVLQAHLPNQSKVDYYYRVSLPLYVNSWKMTFDKGMMTCHIHYTTSAFRRARYSQTMQVNIQALNIAKSINTSDAPEYFSQYDERDGRYE